MLTALLYVTKVRVYCGEHCFSGVFGPLSSGICAHAVVLCDMTCAVDRNLRRRNILVFVSSSMCVHNQNHIELSSKLIDFDIKIFDNRNSTNKRNYFHRC